MVFQQVSDLLSLIVLIAFLSAVATFAGAFTGAF